MRVKVFDYCDKYADYEEGLQIQAQIAPALLAGEEVVLDFEGVRWFTPAFFGASVGQLIVKDMEDRIERLLRYENLGENGRIALDLTLARARHRRENPAFAAAWDAAVLRRSQETWEE